MASKMATLLQQQNKDVNSSYQLLKNTINQSTGFSQYISIKHFTYTTQTEHYKAFNGIERNVHIWLDSIEKNTPPQTHSSLDKIEIAKNFTLPDARQILDKCIILCGTNWVLLKAKFTAMSLPEPYNALKLIDEIINIERLPGEYLQGIVLRLEDLGNRLSLDKSYSNLVNPLLCDAFSKFLPIKFHRNLTEQDKTSLFTVLKKALIFKIENPDQCSSNETVRINHIKKQKSLSKHSSQNEHKRLSQNTAFKYANKNNCQIFQNKSKKFHCCNSANKLVNHKKIPFKGIKDNYYVGRKNIAYPLKSAGHRFYQPNYSSNSPQFPQNRDKGSHQHFKSSFKPKNHWHPNNCRQNQAMQNWQHSASEASKFSIGKTARDVLHIVTMIGCLCYLI